MMKLQNVLFIFVFLGATSCFKQSAPDVQSDYNRGVTDVRRLDACSHLNFNEDFLGHKNIVALFECTQWDEQFRHMYSSIKQISPNSWNTIFRPVGKEFFDNRGRRDRMIGYMRELDRQEALDDLGFVLAALNETNVYNALNSLFECVKKPSEANCRGDKNNIQIDDLVNIVSILDQSSESYSHLIGIFSKTLNSLKPESEVVRNEVTKFYHSNEFQRLRIGVVDALMTKALSGIEDQDRSFVQSLLRHDETTGMLFLYDLLHSVDMDEEYFTQLLKYALEVKPNILNDVVGLSKAVSSFVACEPTAANRYLSFSFDKEVLQLAKNLASNNPRLFLQMLVSRVNLLKTAEVFCPIVREYRYSLDGTALGQYVFKTERNLDFLSLAVDVSDYVEDSTRFDLLSFLVKSSFYQGNPSHYLMDFLSSDIFQTLHLTNSLVNTYSEDFYPVLYRLLKRYPREVFEDAISLVEILNDPLEREKIQSLAKVWHFFSHDEKNFLFKFVDRHLDHKTDYINLFSFYIKLMEEFTNVREPILDSWIGSSERQENMLNSMSDFSRLFSGSVVLDDFRKFFSRDHIIEVIRVITRGVALTEEALATYRYIYSDEYVNNHTEYRFPLGFNDQSTLLTCLRGISDIQRNFYALVKNPPQECSVYSRGDVGITFLHWMHQIQRDFAQFFGTDEDLFDAYGLLSPRNINSFVASAKVLNDTWPEGLGGLQESFYRHLFVKKRIESNQLGFLGHFEQMTSSLGKFLDIEGKKSEIYRNALVKKITTIDRSWMRSYLSLWTERMSSYGAWLDKYTAQTVAPAAQNLSCARFLNQYIGYQCPKNAGEVSKPLRDLMSMLNRRIGKSEVTPLDLLFEGMRAEGGIKIPLNSPSGSPYRLTLKETLSMLHAKTDKSKSLNRMSVPFRLRMQSDRRDEVMTTAERIEVVVRDINFGNNYLGVQYMNHVSHGQDYNADVIDRRDLMGNCIRIPVARCGRFMSQDEQRMAQNVLWAFNGLLDVNNGRNLDASMKYGSYMKTLLAILVGSSDKTAQVVQFLPLKDEQLVLHNGVIFGQMAKMGAFSHLGRWVQDRFGVDRRQLEVFLNSYMMNHIDRTLFLNFPAEQTKQRFERMVTFALAARRGVSPADEFVKWVYRLNRNELIRVERIFGKLYGIASHIGPAEIILGESSRELERFNDHSLYEFLDVLEILFYHFHELKQAMPSQMNLAKFIIGFEQGIEFLYSGLEDPRTRREFYVLVNDLAKIARELLLVPQDSPQIVARQAIRVKGIEKLEKLLKAPSLLKESLESLLKLEEYAESLKFDDDLLPIKGHWYSDTGRNLKALIENRAMSFSEISDYFMMTSKNAICLSDTPECQMNKHYDEPYKLLKYLVSKKDNRTRLEIGARTYFERRNDIDEFVDILMSSIELKSE